MQMENCANVIRGELIYFNMLLPGDRLETCSAFKQRVVIGGNDGNTGAANGFQNLRLLYLQSVEGVLKPVPVVISAYPSQVADDHLTSCGLLKRLPGSI